MILRPSVEASGQCGVDVKGDVARDREICEFTQTQYRYLIRAEILIHSYVQQSRHACPAHVTTKIVQQC